MKTMLGGLAAGACALAVEAEGQRGHAGSGAAKQIAPGDAGDALGATKDLPGPLYSCNRDVHQKGTRRSRSFSAAGPTLAQG